MWQKRIKHDDRPFACKRNSKQQKQGILSCIKLFNTQKQPTLKNKLQHKDAAKQTPKNVKIILEQDPVLLPSKNAIKDTLAVDTDEGCFSCDPSEGSCDYASLVN